MKNILLLLFIIQFYSTCSSAQNESDLYKNIYKTADRLKASGKTSCIDTNNLFKEVIKLDKKHPSDFFKYSGNLMNDSKFNEASFIYYLGLMRFRYFNSANPNYQASGDGALLGSLKYAMGEPINMYLRTDVDNFIFIIKLARKYYSEHDYKYFPKDKYLEKFDAQCKSYQDLITDLETNKEKYKSVWASERKSIEENLENVK